MTRTNKFASLIAASLLATASAIAGPWDGHNELEQSILNDLDKPAYVGTSASEARQRVDAYQGGFSRNPDLDQSSFAVGAAGPERGQGDSYGWIVLDIER
jgi:hypothetical protein